MKKAMIALFSVSVTAGTTYLVYNKFKSVVIKKLLKAWSDEAKKKGKSLDEAMLQRELENNLYAWDLSLLAKYSVKYISHAPQDEVSGLLEKIKKRNIQGKANLKSLEGIIF